MILVALIGVLVFFALSCGNENEKASDTLSKGTKNQTETEEQSKLPDGEYIADFETDSSMFHVNETKDGKGILTVKNGEMTIHISLVSKNIVNLYPGLADDAKKDGADLLEPTTDQIAYPDGTSEEVYGFDVPVEEIGKEFDLALIGKKGKWYDHKVKVENPLEKNEASEE